LILQAVEEFQNNRSKLNQWRASDWFYTWTKKNHL
jgi:hypothetical protein